jgi:hypothetical protein
MSSPIISNYVLGQSDHEYERLMLQARILRPYTEKFFRAEWLALPRRPRPRRPVAGMRHRRLEKPSRNSGNLCTVSARALM